MATQIGYKASELGMIPQDWEVEELRTVAKVEMCRRIFKNETLNVGDIPFYKIGTFGGEADAYISRQLFEEYKSKYPYPKIGDVLISAAGTIGRVVVFDGEEAYYQDSNIVWLNINKAKISNSFLYYFYQNTEWNSLEGSAIKRLYNNDLLSKKIAIPKSTTEQTAIAIALSDTDALISSLQKLIAKKKAIKLSAMQNLLSGKIRLPEFAQRPDGSLKTTQQTELGVLPEDWEVVELGEVVELFSSGATPSRSQPQFFKGNNLWITSGELNYCVITNTIEKISDKAIEHSNLRKHPIGTFLMAITGLEAAGTRGSCAIVGAPATTNQSCMAIYPNERLKTEFLYQWYVLNGNQLAFKYCQGTKQLSYTASLLKKIPILLPKSITEQTAIAQLLSDMDAEIEALECRLKKTQSLKQGMMQALLTGKIRLPLE